MLQYEEYLKSEQKEKEDQVFLEFNRKHGLDDKEYSCAFDGVITAICITGIIATVAWLVFF